MDWLDRMNAAMQYVEDHLHDELDYDAVAKEACCSTYHFRLMFNDITGIPLSEYVRRRRLTEAALELQQSDIKVIDLAIKYGYDSPDAFTRAFYRQHGVTPSVARKHGVDLTAYHRLHFQITLKGDQQMKYRIVEKAPFTVFGEERIVEMTEENSTDIPAFWQEAHESGLCCKLAESYKPHEDYKGLFPSIGIMCYRRTGEGTMPYMIGSFAHDGEVPKGYQRVDVEAHTWAIFTTDYYTEETMVPVVQGLWSRIFPEWFPNSGYEHAIAPDLELYFGDEEAGQYCEIWIPIVKKS